jgi:hypothetical protein
LDVGRSVVGHPWRQVVHHAGDAHRSNARHSRVETSSRGSPIHLSWIEGTRISVLDVYDMVVDHETDLAGVADALDLSLADGYEAMIYNITTSRK